MRCPFCNCEQNNGLNYCVNCGAGFGYVNPYSAQQNSFGQPAQSYGAPSQSYGSYAPPDSHSVPLPQQQRRSTAEIARTVTIKTANGKAHSAMILGILALVFSNIVVLGVIFGIIAIVKGAGARKTLKSNKQPCGKATAGIVLGVFGIIIEAVLWILVIVFYQQITDIMTGLFNS